MKKVILLSSGVALAALLFTGCAKNSTPISLYQAPKDDIVLNIKQDEVKKGKELIEATGAKLLGVVLNRMPKDKRASYYAYYGTDES